MELNKTYYSKDKNKQSRIIFHNNNYIALRIFKYFTSMGNNSTGNEIKYSDFNIAIQEETKYLLK